MTLPLLFQDDHLVVVNKPSGLLVHRSSMDKYETQFALQTVRDQIGKLVYPVHRLDKATSGALIFALSSDVARLLSLAFAQGRIEKKYLTVVRGIPATQNFVLDYPLKEELDPISDAMARSDKAAQSAVTAFSTLASYEFQEKVDKYPTSWYSLLRAEPKTGRKHQIRRHLHHLKHPIIGDTSYGSGIHNRFFRSRLECHRLLLACTELAFTHPIDGCDLRVSAPLAADFAKIVEALGWSNVDGLPLV